METALYAPVKAFLEARGFAVKGEVRGCDLVALKDGDAVHVLVGELKTSFTLELLLQGVDRIAVADEVWLAVGMPKRGRGRESDARVRKLCRLLGLGLLGVFADGAVELLVEPGAWAPRRNLKEKAKLVAEHRRRTGDTALGGSTRVPILTAYRQQALVIARALSATPCRPRDLKAACPDAGKILQHNVYGWFERVERGVYALTPAGQAALKLWP